MEPLPQGGTMDEKQDGVINIPNLTENSGSLSLTVSIDKSVGRYASWLIGILITAVAISILSLAYAWSAHNRAEDMRLHSQARYEDLSERFRILDRKTEQWREDMRVQAIALASHGIKLDEHATEKGPKK